MNRKQAFKPGEHPKGVPESSLSEGERESAASMRVVARALIGADGEDRSAAQRIVEGSASNADFERFSQRVRSEKAKIPAERG